MEIRVEENPAEVVAGMLVEAAERGCADRADRRFDAEAGLRDGRAREARTGAASTVWFSDERCVPPESGLSNFRMANDGAAGAPGSSAIAARRSMRMEGELGPDAGAAAYEALVREHLGGDAALGPACCSGSGRTRHCASLFPGKPEVEERSRLVTGVRARGDGAAGARGSR